MQRFTFDCFAAFLLISSVAFAAEQTVKGKIKTVDVAKKSITLDDLTLDVTRKSKITVDGKSATLGELKVGRSADVKYDDVLDAAITITISIESDVVSDVGELLTFKGHTGGVRCVAFSPDGKTVASGQGVIFGIGEAGKPKEFPILLWDAETKKEIRRFNGHKETVRTVAFSPDGQQIVSGSWDKTIRLWDVKTGKQIRSFEGHSREVTGGITFTADGNRIFSGSVDKTARMWDVKTGEELKTFAAKGEVHCISLSPDDRFLMTGETRVNDENGNTVMSLWDIAKGKLLRRFSGLKGGMNTLSFSPDGRRVLTGGTEWVMQLWDVETGDELNSFEGNSCCFTPDGKSIFANSKDKCLVLWDLESGKEFRRFDGHDKAICVAVSRDGRKALSGGLDKTVKVWGLPHSAPEN